MKTLVFNKSNGGLTEVEYPFGSMVSFAGVVLGFGLGGLAVLNGSRFAGTDVVASVALPSNDYGLQQHKHIRAGYVTGKGLDLAVTVNADQRLSYSTTCSPVSTESHTARFGGQRDTRGRQLQILLQNRNGSFFTLEQIELIAIALYRKDGR